MTTVTARRPIASAVAGRSDQLAVAFYLAIGVLLLYLVLFDQGQVSDAVVGPLLGQHNLLHEFFHDGRHLANAPCH